MDFLYESSIIDGVPNMVFLWGGVVLLFAVVSILIGINRNKKSKNRASEFLALHPDAVKVFLTAGGVVTSEAVSVHTVDKDHPVLFNEGGKGGFYLTPGRHEVQITYSYSRPGVMYRNVTKTTGAVDKVLEVQAGHSYQLGFDRKQEIFTFADVTGQV